ncbi:MAG: YIP1 family protein [Myxococcaceae bacterium]
MRICPACASGQSDLSRFCSACGAALDAPLAATDTPCAVHPNVPAKRSCPRCATFCCTVCLSSDKERCAACDAREGALLPWDRREELGMFKAYWQTSWMLMSAPIQTFARTSPRGTVGSSLLFVMLSALTGLTTTVLIYAGVLGGISRFAKDKPALTTGVVLVVMVLYYVFAVGATVASALLFSGLDHLMLKLLGAKPSTWETTLRGHALGMAPYLVGVIPLCGLYVFPFWAIVLRIFALRAFHKTTTGKAVAAVVIPFGAFVCLIVAGYGALIAAMMASGKFK